MEQTSGISLGIGAGAPVYKAGASVNGTLLKLGVNNVYTTSFSNVLTPAGVQYEAELMFGNGVFYNAPSKDNVVYAGAPTVASAVPVFAGIVVRSPAIQGAYPANGEGAYQYNKVNIVKDGYMIYRSGINLSAAAVTFSSAEIVVGNYIYVRNTDGAVAFGASATSAGFTTVGRIVQLNPDDESWTVKLDASSAVYTA